MISKWSSASFKAFAENFSDIKAELALDISESAFDRSEFSFFVVYKATKTELPD